MLRWFGVSVSAFVAVASVAGMTDPADAASVAVSVGSVAFAEGDAGTAIVKVPVELSVPSNTSVSVHYVVSGAGASAPSDFKTKSGNLTFLPGKVAKAISVVTYGDTIVEGDEAIAVTLSAPTGAVLGTATGTVTLIEDESDPTSTVSAAAVSAPEGDATYRTVQVPVTLPAPAVETTKVSWDVSCSSASGGDYSVAGSSVTFKVGQRVKYVTVRIYPDVALEDDEDVDLDLSVVVGTSTPGASEGGVTIIDDDAAPSGAPTTTRASVGIGGADAVFPSSECGGVNPSSSQASISADGRYVAFQSNALNLVADDTNDDFDVFVRDTLTGVTERVSVASDELQGDDDSQEASISADGRYVAFVSDATNLVAGDPAWRYGVFVRDRTVGTTEFVGTLPPGVSAAGDSWSPSISADGRYVAFAASVTNAQPLENLNTTFVHDRTAGVTTAVAVDGTGAMVLATAPGLSRDGSTVIFELAHAPDVFAGAVDQPVIVAHDLATGTNEMVSVTDTEAELTGGSGWANETSVSDDGRYVVFTSGATNLPHNGTSRSAYLRDRVAGTTTLIGFTSASSQSGDAAHASVSGDGQWIAFESVGDLAGMPACSGATCGARKVYRLDRSTGTITLASPTVDGSVIGGDAFISGFREHVMSDDGQAVVFHSLAENIVLGDVNQADDVFITRW
jgi:Tol biopolymer transport system component